MSRILRQSLLALLPLGLCLASGIGVRAAPIDLTVMTQNLYVGANTDPLFKSPDILTALIRAEQVIQNIKRNNFPARAGAISAEVQAAGSPLLIGLQEALTINVTGAV